MSVRGFVGKIYLELGEGSPSTFTRLCEATGISGVGQTNELIDDTDFCSNGTREYIAGLADGQEVTVNLKFKQDSTSKIRTLINSVANRGTVELRLVVEEDSPSLLTIRFFAVSLGWVLNPSFTERNMIDFTFKISGAIELSDV